MFWTTKNVKWKILKKAPYIHVGSFFNLLSVRDKYWWTKNIHFDWWICINGISADIKNYIPLQKQFCGGTLCLIFILITTIFINKSLLLIWQTNKSKSYLLFCKQREVQSLNWPRKKRLFSNVAESIEVMPTIRRWILSSALIVALFYWVEKNKGKTYLEQTYDIITLLANQTRKIPLDKFKYKPISFDMKRLAIWKCCKIVNSRLWSETKGYKCAMI